MVSIMKDWHKRILLYLAGRKTPATPENIKQYLKRYEISKSHTAITTACKESLSDILTRHDHSTYNDDGTVRLPRFKYSLNQDTDTFATLLNMFVGTKDQKEFLASAYCKQMTQDWSPHCLAQAPPAQMSDSMRSVFDADKKEFPDASEPSFPIDAEIVSLAVPPDDLHRIVGEMIVEHATYLAQLIHRFYPKLQLNAELIGFLHEVERARQTGVATCTETT